MRDSPELHPAPPPKEGRQVSPSFFNAPPIVLHLAGLIIACHLVFLLSPAEMKAWLAWYGAVSPSRITRGVGGAVMMAPPLITHMFLHAGWLHLLLNSVWLLAFGSPVARRLGAAAFPGDRPNALAGISFVSLFLASGVAGALTYIGAHPNDPTLLIGASGGVSGLLGALVRFAFRPPFAPAFGFAGLLERQVIVWTGVIIAMNVAIGVFGAGLTGDGAGIAWEAHVGGYMFGLVAFPVFARLARSP